VLALGHAQSSRPPDKTIHPHPSPSPIVSFRLDAPEHAFRWEPMRHRTGCPIGTDAPPRSMGARCEPDRGHRAPSVPVEQPIQWAFVPDGRRCGPMHDSSRSSRSKRVLDGRS